MSKNQFKSKLLPLYPAIEQFNLLWREKIITTPLCILVGGYAGTGKSTLIEIIKQHIQYLTAFSTGFARASAQAFVTNKQNPALYQNTFKLHELSEHIRDNKSITELFLEQRQPVNEVIKNVIRFIATEKRHVAIDGNHLSPHLLTRIENDLRTNQLILIDVYLKVTNPEVHKIMLEGPTHNRQLTQQEFATARILHDYMVSEIEMAGKTAFEYDKAESLTLSKINSLLTKIIEKSINGESC